jgi:drug/metabolite transporter (DMT)-like permease
MWGVSDFLGGAASRRTHPLRVAMLSVPIGIIPLVVLSLVIPGRVSPPLIWVGLSAGLAGVAAILLLYVVLAAGPMGVMSPLTAVVAAVVPVGVGLVLGERPRPLAYLGMALAVVAIILVSVEPRRDDDSEHQRVRPKILAYAVGCGLLIGAYMSIIGTAPADSGIYPVLFSRSVSAAVVVVLAFARFRGGAFDRSILVTSIWIGVLDASANALFRLSTQSGLLAVVAVLASLYPAGTVILARFYLHERLRLAQQVGMVTALAAAALLALA